MSKQQRLKDPALEAVPQSLEAVEYAISDIGARQRVRADLEVEMNEKLAKIREEYQAKVAEHDKVIGRHFRGIQAWCEANRDQLTDGKKRQFANLGTGTISWRKLPESVKIAGEAEVIERLKAAGLARFVRVKESIDKKAILKQQAAVADIEGISIQGGELFAVEPFETSLAVVAS